jgi:acetyl-CoA carboxylase carboxyl transferase subunit beta
VTPRGKLKEEIVSILRMLLREPPAVMADLPAPAPVVAADETLAAAAE